NADAPPRLLDHKTANLPPRGTRNRPPPGKLTAVYPADVPRPLPLTLIEIILRPAFPLASGHQQGPNQGHSGEGQTDKSFHEKLLGVVVRAMFITEFSAVGQPNSTRFSHNSDS